VETSLPSGVGVRPGLHFRTPALDCKSIADEDQRPCAATGYDRNGASPNGFQEAKAGILSGWDRSQRSGDYKPLILRHLNGARSRLALRFLLTLGAKRP